jgi:hypothetical protein
MNTAAKLEEAARAPTREDHTMAQPSHLREGTVLMCEDQLTWEIIAVRPSRWRDHRRYWATIVATVRTSRWHNHRRWCDHRH